MRRSFWSRLAFWRKRGYEGAARSPRFGDMRAPSTSASAETRLSLVMLRNRHRTLIRDDAHANYAAEQWVEAVIGTGIHPRFTADTDRKAKTIADLWAAWQDRCESTDRLDWLGTLESLAYDVFGGEALVRFRPRRMSDGYAVPLQLQLLEADRLDHYKDDDRTGDIQGVRFNAYGKRVGYWMHPKHPGDRGATLESVLVGASEMLHLYHQTRSEQVRGITRLASVIKALRDAGDYADAEAVKNKIQAALVGVVMGDEDAPMSNDPNDHTVGFAATDADGNVAESFVGGHFYYARGARDVKFNSPTLVANYEEHVKTDLRRASGGMGIPYHMVANDYADVNFAAGKLALGPFSGQTARFRSIVFVRGFCKPVMTRWLDVAVAAGKLPEGEYGVTWSNPIVEALDRVAEADADDSDIRNRLVTRAEIVARRSGRTFAEHVAELALEVKIAAAAGITLDDATARPVKLVQGKT